MAKSSRSSANKANNQRLKKNVFGPVEAARNERLSAKLLELVSQPKPVREEKMSDAVAMDEDTQDTEAVKTAPTTAMEVDGRKSSRSKPKSRISKRRSKIVFPKWKKKTTT